MSAMRIVRQAVRSDVVLAAPPSKAHTLRALFMASLARGRSVICNALLGKDQQAAIECLRRLGVTIICEDEGVVVHGVDGEYLPVAGELHVGESGVSARFLTALACLSASPVTVTGVRRITERPVGELVNGLRELGCRVDYLGEEGFPPVLLHGGGIPGGRASMHGSSTSQFFSAMLTAVPYAALSTRVACLDDMSEKPYVDVTLALMREFGVEVDREGYESFLVPNDAGYRGRELSIEGDYSSASFFFEAAAVCGARVSVSGLRRDSEQGDRRMLQLLERMGCGVQWEGGLVTVEGGELKAIEEDMGDVPDLVPPLAVAAAFADGRTCLTNIAQLRHKECDRLAVIVSELEKMGAQACCDESSLTVIGGTPAGAQIDPHNDHRIAMAFAIAGLVTGGQRIQQPDCVAKSFPDFWDRIGRFL